MHKNDHIQIISRFEWFNGVIWTTIDVNLDAIKTRKHLFVFQLFCASGGAFNLFEHTMNSEIFDLLDGTF